MIETAHLPPQPDDVASYPDAPFGRLRLTLADNAYHTFVTVPRRLPELVYRYVFARHSFYAPPPAPPPAAPPTRQ